MATPNPAKPSAKAPRASAFGPKPSLLSVSVALMLPALLVLWAMLARASERMAWDVTASAWASATLKGLIPVQETLHQPFARGGWFALAVLSVAALARLLSMERELLLLLSVQGMALLSFSALVTFAPQAPANLDVLLYQSLALIALLVTRWRAGAGAMWGVCLVVAPCSLVMSLAYMASGVWASVVLMSTLLALAMTLTLATAAAR